VFSGSNVMTEVDTKDWQSGIGKNLTPAKQKASAESLLKLYAGRLVNWKRGYINATGLQPEPILSAKAVAQLHRMNIDPDIIAALTEGMDIRKIGFDRHRMKTLQAELDRLDVVLPFEEFGQGFVSMGPAVDRAEIEFLHERFRHGGHPVMTMCAANAIIVQDAAGNRKMDKSKSTGRIDGMISLAMAVGVAGLDAAEPEACSPWDDPNFSLMGAAA
jgi:hypothetical protein